MRQRAILGVALWSITLMAGCGASDSLNRQAIQGEIKLDGQPLASGSITFEPQAEGTSGGAAITDGMFSIPAERGLPPGEYLVRINASEGGSAEPGPPGMATELPKELIPAKFNSESDTKFTVQSGTENVFNLDIPSK